MTSSTDPTVAGAAGGATGQAPPSPPTELDDLRGAVSRARAALLRDQASDGHFVYPLEADATIPAELVLWMHFTGDVDEALQGKLAVYLRRTQAEHGGWPLYHGGDLDLSATVKAYWALKLAGEDPDSEPMTRARSAILARGGAARANVFTRYALALFGHVPWRAVPFLPVEIVLLPRWFPFHIEKVSYWSRTVMVPLAVLYSLRARAKNPTGIGLEELFLRPAEDERSYFPARSVLERVFFAVERGARLFEPLIPRGLRRIALARAEAWMVERRNGTDGLGGIFPAMVNLHEALGALGYADDHPWRIEARQAILRLVVDQGELAWCQPCVSPVWDTGLAMLALAEAQALDPDGETEEALGRAARWLRSKQVLSGPADWRVARPDLPPGGWAFQYANPHYPDVDDTAVAGWALWLAARETSTESIARAADWIRGMQSENGGYGAFDVDNTHTYLNEIPFADHGALLDPPTADVSGRCATLLALLEREEDRTALKRLRTYLLSEQEADGSWFGRWGTNYVYGTWSVLEGLVRIDDDECRTAVDRALEWLQSVQRPDGSFGESNFTYFDATQRGRGTVGTPFQTAWALLAFAAAGRAADPCARRAAGWLLEHQEPDGSWNSPEFTAPGFPRVFYLRYHGYVRYFPLWALARYARELAKR